MLKNLNKCIWGQKKKKIGNKLFGVRECKKTWGHSMKLEWFNLKLRREFFTVRAVRMWNSLPQSVVSAGNIYSLKKKKSWKCILASTVYRDMGNYYEHAHPHRLNWCLLVNLTTVIHFLYFFLKGEAL